MGSPLLLADTFQNNTGSDYTTLGSHTSDNGTTWTVGTGGANAFAISPTGWLRGNINGQSVMTNSGTVTGTSVIITYDVQQLSTEDFLDIEIGQFLLRNNVNGGIQLLNPLAGYSEIATTNAVLGTTPVHVEFHCSQTSQTIYINGVSGWTDPGITANTVSGPVSIQTDSSTSQSDTVGTQIANLYCYSVSNLSNEIAPDNTNVVLSPGNQWVNPGVSLQWIFPGTYAKLGFTGTSCIANLSTASLVGGSRTQANYPYLVWSVDSAKKAIDALRGVFHDLPTPPKFDIPVSVDPGTDPVIVHIEPHLGKIIYAGSAESQALRFAVPRTGAAGGPPVPQNVPWNNPAAPTTQQTSNPLPTLPGASAVSNAVSSAKADAHTSQLMTANAWLDRIELNTRGVTGTGAVVANF